ncbi:MAG: hypothetical protein LKE45_03460 [Olsenella sp.]|nr:hypothetical protein [Olsenella sp.]
MSSESPSTTTPVLSLANVPAFARKVLDALWRHEGIDLIGELVVALRGGSVGCLEIQPERHAE